MRKHISEDGQVRTCKAKTPETCTAKGPNGEKAEHFTNEAEARKRSEEILAEQYDNFPISKKSNKAKTEEPKEFYVEDNWGDVMPVKAGELNEETKSLFRQGQCLALATQLANKFGTDKLLAIVEEQESDEFLWDEEANDFVYDEDGNEIIKTEKVIHHFYAIDKDGNAWDIDGIAPKSIEVQKFYEDRDYITEVGTVSELTNKHEGWMSEQNYEFADTVVDEVLKAD